MPGNVSSVHPRKLYDTLLACPGPEARARSAFDFLRNRAASDGGFMFLARRGELVLAASSHHGDPPEDMVHEARRIWKRAFDSVPDDVQTRTLDAKAIEAAASMPPPAPHWTSATLGLAFERRVLGTYRGARWCPIGVVFLKAGPAVIPIRHVHIEALTNAIIDAGDVGEI